MGEDGADGGDEEWPDPNGRDGRGDGRRRRAPAAQDLAPEDHAEELAEIMEDLDDLEDVADTPEEREQVRETRRRVLKVASGSRAFGNVITGYDASDVAEAFLGSLLLGIPMFVEGGTIEIGEFLATRPAILGGTILANVLLVIGVLYVADIQDVRVHEPLFGVVPRRLVGVLVVAYGSAVLLMTAWGRVDWALSADAFAKCVVAAVPMTLGAALGDILPGS